MKGASPKLERLKRLSLHLRLLLLVTALNVDLVVEENKKIGRRTCHRFRVVFLQPLNLKG